MTPADVYIDFFERVLENGAAVVGGLDDDQLAHRPTPDANSIAWLVWHAARGQDAQIADVAGTEQVWHTQGWVDRFGLDLDPDDHGYGHTSEQVGKVRASGDLLAAYLTATHEPLVGTQALNHVSPFFGDVVWRGLSTEHVREGLDGHVDLEQLRNLWRPISPWSFLERLHDKRTLMVYAKYDLTFPVDLSLKLIDEIRRRSVPLEVRVLPCGHYSTGAAPFKYIDGWYLGRFLATQL